jgi:chemotaxis protein histidine kinase CheA
MSESSTTKRKEMETEIKEKPPSKRRKRAKPTKRKKPEHDSSNQKPLVQPKKRSKTNPPETQKNAKPKITSITETKTKTKPKAKTPRAKSKTKPKAKTPKAKSKTKPKAKTPRAKAKAKPKTNAKPKVKPKAKAKTKKKAKPKKAPKKAAIIIDDGASAIEPLEISAVKHICMLCQSPLLYNTDADTIDKNEVKKEDEKKTPQSTVCQDCYQIVLNNIHHTHEDTSRLRSLPDDMKQAIACTFVHPHPSKNVSADFWSRTDHGFKCWYDHHVFNGPIFSYPDRYEHNKFVVWGVFCSPFCTKAYILAHQKPKLSLFTLMMRKVYKYQESVPVASDVELLLDPFNPLPIDQWRQMPIQKMRARICNPSEKPFMMKQQKIFGHILPEHPCFRKMRQWNEVMVEQPIQ